MQQINFGSTCYQGSSITIQVGDKRSHSQADSDDEQEEEGSDDTYRTEESVNLNETLTVKKYILTFEELNKNSLGREKEYNYDESNSIVDRLSISCITLETFPELELAPQTLNQEEYSQLKEWRMKMKKKTKCIFQLVLQHPGGVLIDEGAFLARKQERQVTVSCNHSSRIGVLFFSL
ncbi:unnamed protein product [Mucor hiemalis]